MGTDSGKSQAEVFRAKEEKNILGMTCRVEATERGVNEGHEESQMTGMERG